MDIILSYGKMMESLNSTSMGVDGSIYEIHEEHGKIVLRANHGTGEEVKFRLQTPELGDQGFYLGNNDVKLSGNATDLTVEALDKITIGAVKNILIHAGSNIGLDAADIHAAARALPVHEVTTAPNEWGYHLTRGWALLPFLRLWLVLVLLLPVSLPWQRQGEQHQDGMPSPRCSS
jgi:hypothetical protein